MLKPKTHFEQVPLEIVKKIVEEEISPETKTKRAPTGRKKKSQKDRLAAQKEAIASSRRASWTGVTK